MANESQANEDFFSQLQVFILPLTNTTSSTLYSSLLRFVELLHVPLDLRHHLLVEPPPVTEEEGHLQEDEDGRHEERLGERVDHGRGAVLEHFVAHGLAGPGQSIDGQGHMMRRVADQEAVGGYQRRRLAVQRYP